VVVTCKMVKVRYLLGDVGEDERLFLQENHRSRVVTVEGELHPQNRVNILETVPTDDL